MFFGSLSIGFSPKHKNTQTLQTQKKGCPERIIPQPFLKKRTATGVAAVPEISVSIGVQVSMKTDGALLPSIAPPPPIFVCACLEIHIRLLSIKIISNSKNIRAALFCQEFFVGQAIMETFLFQGIKSLLSRSAAGVCQSQPSKVLYLFPVLQANGNDAPIPNFFPHSEKKLDRYFFCCIYGYNVLYGYIVCENRMKK